MDQNTNQVFRMPLPDPTDIKSFFHGQYFTDGLKITVGVLLPALLFSLQGNMTTGITISLGAFMTSLSDSTGPMEHRRNGMLFTCLFIFLSALITGLLNNSQVLLAIQIPLFCVVFGLFNAFGNRAATVGTAALLVMVISIDHNKTAGANITYAALILSGGIWYMLLSLSLLQIRPYRVAQQTLGECIIYIAEYLSLKGEFYKEKNKIPEIYKKLVKKQIEVNQHQDNVRDVLFKTRIKVKESIRSGQILILIFVDMVDIFEQAMCTHYDYKEMRIRYGKSKILESFYQIISKIVNELHYLGTALINNEKPKKRVDFETELQKLLTDIDSIKDQNTLMLKKIYVNLTLITGRLENTFNYFQVKELSFISKTQEQDLSKFVSHQEIDFKVLVHNLSFQSTVFRHALRLALVCLLGYLIALQFPWGQNSYWILLTILVILKPGFSLTKKRNIERVIGTIIGGIIGVAILYFIPDNTIRFFLLVLFMVAAYTFMRIHYIISVIFMTPLILVLFSFIHPSPDLLIVQERIVDTLVGSGIAFLASNYLFPSWEYGQLHQLMKEVLRSNLDYLQQISKKLKGELQDNLSYKLTRKNVYVHSANLAAAFQRMLEEPKRKQVHPKTSHQFVVLNHILTSYLATFSSNITPDNTPQMDADKIKLIRKSERNLIKAIESLSGETNSPLSDPLKEVEQLVPDEKTEEDLVTEQLLLIQKITVDIERIAKKLSGQEE